MTTQTLMHVRTSRDGVLSRRTFLRTVAAGASAGALGWQELLAQNAGQLRRENKACILLYMRGGPSQFESFDPKVGHANGGPTRDVQTSVTGVRIAETWANTARELQHMAVIRSMNNREGEHQRATYLMHTGYLPSGAIRYPSIGSLVA